MPDSIMSREPDSNQARTDADANRIEKARLRDAYARRTPRHDSYAAAIRPSREMIFRRHLQSNGLPSMDRLSLLEVGCGTGAEMKRMLELGVRPENLTGIELLEDRFESARAALPDACTVIRGDAATVDLPDRCFDVVFACTVFTSILEEDVRRRLAGNMWRMVAPGGGVLVYDFIWNNPRNPDVRGVSRGELAMLFPDTAGTYDRVTLAPPIGRPLARWAPGLISPLEKIPILRSHLVAWFRKAPA
jgi:SAM-dependent methyltransferase